MGSNQSQLAVERMQLIINVLRNATDLPANLEAIQSCGRKSMKDPSNKDGDFPIGERVVCAGQFGTLH